VVQNTIGGMDTIREQIQETSKRIKRLGESSQEIGDIVSLINDISDQTNILALNAAIQASMAGDAGRGFAVVADEVQRLAERSGAATKQIEALVKTIQSDTQEAVLSMEQTTAEVVRGARLAEDAGVALEEIESVSKNLAALIQNISNAARQQASSAGHVSNTMNIIQEITSQTSAGTTATAQSIGKLAGITNELRNSVAGFTLPDEGRGSGRAR
jgi:twitching motility protein PilJ